MNIHEYQAKTLLASYDVAVPRGYPAFSVDEAVVVAGKLGGAVWVVKAQIHAGGRGKGGGVKVVKSIQELQTVADEMLGMNLVTHQTGAQGKKVGRLYIEKECDIAKELYLGMLVDRISSRVAIIASTEGGMDIEEVAATHPDKISKVTIDPVSGFQPFQARKLLYGLGLPAQQVKQGTAFLANLYKGFTELDASLIEINPWVVTGDGSMIALDAKMNFDSNALYRQKQVVSLRDESEEETAEIEASQYNLNYIKLNGNIGCMVNGAGLAMATMDIIKLYGASPANFLDVGGGATKEKVTEAFKIILSDDNIAGILVNIFGGIMRCDVIAEGIITGAKEVNLLVPLVVRLEGTNVEQGKAILSNSGLSVIAASDLSDAAQKIVQSVKQAN